MCYLTIIMLEWVEVFYRGKIVMALTGSNPGGNVFSWLFLLLAMLAMMGAMPLYFHRKCWL